jgi:CheY-like chemotaxis protein
MLERAGLSVQALDPAAQTTRLQPNLGRAEVLFVDVSCANPVELNLLEKWRASGMGVLPPCVALAAAGGADWLEHSARAGIAHWLTKPARPEELWEAAEAVLGLANTDGDYPLDRADHLDTRPLRLLVADDSPVNQEVAKGLLELRGHSVATASTGREAVAMWQEEHFDAILMDVEMPEMDGFAATAMIRQAESSGDRRTPVFALSAHAMKGMREECLAMGMDGYVAKPLQPAELFALLDGLPRMALPSPQTAPLFGA